MSPTDRPVIELGRPGDEGLPDNEAVIAALSSPAPGPMAQRLLLLLHFTGRRTGRAFTIPVGAHTLDDQLVLATSGTWRHNFAGGADAEITWQGARQAARLELVTEPVRVANSYLRLIRLYGPAAQRRLDLTINSDGPPTTADLRDAVERYGLSLIDVRLLAPGPSAPTESAAPERTRA
ncbi:hypothetical protein [Streptomyces sp. H39-S7]|uniref:hypothetical protein n=1 Tax=Streptomyces sp. H39-S7 TaxID=3004357 RepID=UPI0022AEBDF8|nr:hypothetical protein [Streptomyces sp. H39-S7]MCZ4125827.1 hypothetical protein [Streptomyces sp. H39-S7]